MDAALDSGSKGRCAWPGYFGYIRAGESDSGVVIFVIIRVKAEEIICICWRLDLLTWKSQLCESGADGGLAADMDVIV